MKLLWYSTAPHVGVAYGVLTRALVHRLIADGHEVKIATKHHLGGTMFVEGVEVFDGRETGLINKIIEDENYDYIISVMDTWAHQEPFVRWVAGDLLDAEFIHTKTIQALKKSEYQIAHTEHAKREMERVGFKPFYAPLGIDAKLFRPDPERRKEARESKGWSDDTFVIGLVGINYPGDRKNIIGTLRAFQGFHQRHPNSALYLHTDMMGSATHGSPLIWVTEACGFDVKGDGKSGPVRWVDQKAYHLWNISHEEIARMYNAFDVFCLASHGEGFGLPWVEAQASGCPIINVNNTSGKQLNFGGYLIPRVEDFFNFSNLLTWYIRVPPSEIDRMFEEAYQEWENGKIVERQEKARAGALDYDWDTVFDKYWRPMLEVLKGKKVHIVPDLPNYGTDLYENFNGRILMVDCKNMCKQLEACELEYALLPGEWEGPRSILSRSYPIIPDKEGKLFVATKCTIHTCMSPRFTQECTRVWDFLFRFPQIRKRIAELWDNGYFNTYGPFVPLNEIKPTFNMDYKNAMQTLYWTTFKLTDPLLELIPKGGKVLDVGTGDGNRVKELRAKGFDAIGTEVNSSWIDGDVIIPGDVENLPFADDSFDMVMSIDVLEHVEHPHKAIDELLRVSRDKVVIQITPVEDATYIEDPTHKVDWPKEQWMRELAEHADVTHTDTNQLGGFVLSKRRGNENKCGLP